MQFDFVRIFKQDPEYIYIYVQFDLDLTIEQRHPSQFTIC